MSPRSNAAIARATKLARLKASFAEPVLFDPLRRPTALYDWPRKVARAGMVVEVVIPGDPLSKQRPRAAWSRDGVRMYTPKDTVAAESAVRSAIVVANRSLVPDKDSAFSVRLSFHPGSWQRRDTDNMVKLVLDACTGTVWADDSQVIEIFARTLRGDAEPRTEVVVVSLGAGLLHPQVRCLSCEKWFPVHPSGQATRMYCSRGCRDAARASRAANPRGPCSICGKPSRSPRSAKVRTCSPECYEKAFIAVKICSHCGTEFRVPQSWATNRRYCSPGCRGSALIARRKHDWDKYGGTCEACGGTTSKPSYRSCVGCLRRGGRRSSAPETARA